MKIQERSWVRDAHNAADVKAPDSYVYVVVGSGSRRGTVKTIPFRKEMASPILNVQKTGRGRDVTIAADYRDLGWVLLDDAYEAEPELTAKDKDGNEIDMEECRRRFYAFQEHLRGAGRAVVPKAMRDNIVPGFPDEMLPKLCRELRDSRDPLAGVYDPTVGKVVNRTKERDERPKADAKPKRRTA